MKSASRADFSAAKSVFGFHVSLQNPKSGFKNLNSDFPIEGILNESGKTPSSEVTFCYDESARKKFTLIMHTPLCWAGNFINDGFMSFD